MIRPERDQPNRVGCDETAQGTVMAKDFYTKWLGIPPGERPPDHYMLLGVPRFCEDMDAVEAAARARLTRLDEYAMHPHRATRDAVQDMMNAVARARVVLVNPRRCKAYDEELARKLGIPAGGTSETAQQPAPRPSPQPPPRPAPPRPPQPAPRPAPQPPRQRAPRPAAADSTATRVERPAPRPPVMAPVTIAPESDAPPMARLAPTDDDIRRFEQRARAHLRRLRLNPHEERLLLAEAAGVNIEASLAREIIRRIDREVESWIRRRRRWRTAISTALVLVVTAGLLAAIVRTWPDGFDTRPAEKTGPEAKAPQKEPAEQLGLRVDKRLQLGKGVSLGLALIPSGQFRMGSPQSGTSANSDEKPQHTVTIAKPFYMGITEVTQAQWKAVMGTEPWKGKKYTKDGGENAASYISWTGVMSFCQKLSAKLGRAVRLPTEAEWEYACRAGSKTAYCFGDDDSQLGDYAWYTKNTRRIGEKYAHAVGRKKPNAWGLYDMHGNVWEWCADYYGEKYYAAGGNTVDPTGPGSGSSRVLRGGSFGDVGGRYCRSAGRVSDGPGHRSVHYGFRVVLSVVGRGRSLPQSRPGKPPETGGRANRLPEAGSRPPTSAPVRTERPSDAREAKRQQQETAKKLKIPVEKTLQFGNGISMRLALIPPGKFLMGSPYSETYAASNEKPQREVTITKSFYMGLTEVTQGQWRAVMGTEPWKGKGYAKEGAENPALYVSWHDATAFCTKLSQKTGRIIRLPTEAEWEYACRAGSKTRFYFGDDSSKLGDYAWHSRNAYNIGEKYAHPVARKKPNAWGLYDMHGNVWEWCADRCGRKHYSATGNAVDPTGPGSGTYRVLRGGSFCSDVGSCRSAYRFKHHPDYRDDHRGFRVVLPLVARGLSR